MFSHINPHNPPPHPLTNMLYLSLHSLVTQKQPPRHILAPGKLASFAILSHVSSFSTPIVDTLYPGRGGGCRKPVINYHYFTASNLSTNHAHVPVFFLLLTWLPATGAIFHPPVDYSFCGPSLGGRGDPPCIVLLHPVHYLVFVIATTMPPTTSQWREMFISQLLYILLYGGRRPPSGIDKLGGAVS